MGAVRDGYGLDWAEGDTQFSVLAPQSSKGFTLIELIITISIIVILAGSCFHVSGSIRSRQKRRRWSRWRARCRVHW